jgi:hypothetical protein
MKSIILIVLVLIFQSVSYGASHDPWPTYVINTVQENAGREVRSFSKNFLRGKFDSKAEYGEFHRRLGTLAFKDVFFDSPQLAREGEIILSSSQRKTTWFVSVYESTNVAYRCRVECVTSRRRHSGRFKGYEWSPDCAVTGVINH